MQLEVRQPASQHQILLSCCDNTCHQGSKHLWMQLSSHWVHTRRSWTPYWVSGGQSAKHLFSRAGISPSESCAISLQHPRSSTRKAYYSPISSFCAFCRQDDGHILFGEGANCRRLAVSQPSNQPSQHRVSLHFCDNSLRRGRQIDMQFHLRS